MMLPKKMNFHTYFFLSSVYDVAYRPPGLYIFSATSLGISRLSGHTFYDNAKARPPTGKSNTNDSLITLSKGFEGG